MKHYLVLPHPGTIRIYKRKKSDQSWNNNDQQCWLFRNGGSMEVMHLQNKLRIFFVFMKKRDIRTVLNKKKNPDFWVFSIVAYSVFAFCSEFSEQNFWANISCFNSEYLTINFTIFSIYVFLLSCSFCTIKFKAIAWAIADWRLKVSKKNEKKKLNHMLSLESWNEVPFERHIK